ncbi:OmpA family protein [Undibacterium sp. TS12]|uniref:OmpA family protein n=1 Tax=Undibacterium sp. TS12 TaxID=2908202 RepID=UPI001F4CEC32|nr:OmpA family protein [Undibacterium sp. TS12]MCH8618282.1 OmpA family protein [Undibacterium sp. TS12]
MLKPLPRLLLIATVVGAGIYGLNTYVKNNGSLKFWTAKTAVPAAIEIPTQASMPNETSSSAAFNLAPATGNYQARMLVLPWNAETSIHYANGDTTTAPGSLMDKHGVHLQLERQDDYAQMIAEQAIFAGEVAKGVAYPDKGAAFVVIMGDGGPGYFAAARESMSKLGQQIEVVGSLGYSRGEDKCMLPAAVAADPQKARGSLIGAVLRDGDWNICMKYAADNKIPVNPDIKTYDPDAMNFVGVGSFAESDEKLIAANNQGACETRPVVRNGKSTGERRKVCQNGTATWTPGDVKVAREVGGLAAVASTREYMWQMPATIIGNRQWMAQNPEYVKNMLAAAFEATDAIRASDTELLKASAVVAKVAKEENAQWWMKYYKGVIEKDRKGLDIRLGGSTSSNLADNLFLFGLNGNDNLYQRVYNVFGGIAKQYYPGEMPEIVSYEKVVNTTYLQAVAASAKSSTARTDAPRFDQNAPAVATFAKRNWAIEFETGKASFKPEATATLEELLNQMAVSGLPIQINGHTDKIGNPDANLLLSRKRADAVRNWLQANAASGFPEGRVRVRAFGDSQPIADNSSAEGRAHNRRVEVALIKTSNE